jgi:hypothetical protein
MSGSLPVARSSAVRFDASRALLLLAVSLLLHAAVLSALRGWLVGPQRDAAELPRTISASLLVEPPPIVPPRPVQPARPRPRPKPPPKPAPVAEPPAVVAAAPPVQAAAPPPERPAEPEPPAAEPMPEPQVAEPPSAVEPVPAQADPQPAPVVPRFAADSNLAQEMAELGGAAEALPDAGTYVYRMTDSRYSAVTGTTTIEWRVDPATRRYESRLTSSVLGLTVAEITSVGTVRRFGLAPDRYVQKTMTRSAQAANIDWERRVVTFSARSHERPAREGVQDRLSFQFQLMALAQALPDAFRPGVVVTMEVAGNRDVETYRFVVVGPERLETAAGPFDSIKLDRPKGEGADTRIEAWLAPSLRWMAVRMRFTDRRGNVTESLLESGGETR